MGENVYCVNYSGRRGRPKAATINELIMEGASSRSGIRCEVCSRVFPRDKSLQAHRRVHTGERPYPCDFPACTRRFKQSGQLKTHQRLHTGERPFLCSFPGCLNRFTHANRHCQAHPNSQLIRSDDSNLLDSTPNHQSEEVIQWLLKYKAEKRESKCEKRSFSGKSECEDEEEAMMPGRSLVKTELSDVTNLSGGGRSRVDGGSSPLKGEHSASTLLSTPDSPSKRRSLRLTPVKASTPFQPLSSPLNNLFSDDKSPRKRELPKKRWLRIASREQESFQCGNLTRPTVLRHAGFLSSPESTPCTAFPLTPPYSVEKRRWVRHQLPLSPPDTLPPDDDVLATPLNSSLDSSFS